MRIALFSGNYNYMREGANQALNRLVDHALGQGHQVRVYSPVTDTPAFEPAGELVAVPSITFPVRREFQLALGLPGQIREDLRRFSPDLIHVSTPDILGTRAQTFAKRLRVPIVASFHTRFESYLGYYGLGWAVPIAEAHLRRFYRRSDHVLAPTPGIADGLKRMRGDNRVTLWSRGVDRDLFHPRRRDPSWRRAQGWSDQDVAVLFFGRLVVEKGIEDFVSTVRRLRERDIPVKALIVGAGPAAAAFRNLPDAVFTGHLAGDDLTRAIASADILLHPSRTEAFGNVVLEAMAAGLPVVCADADSARALVDHGRTGFLCPPGNVEAFASIVEELAGDPARRREMALAARAASSRFTWEDAAESVLEAYRSLSSAGGR